MRNPESSLKREFLKKWKLCFQASCNSSSSKDMMMMSVTERKNVIKMSADVAMASTRHHSTHWSRSVIRKASRNPSNNALLQCLSTLSNTSSSPITRQQLICGKKIVRRSKKMLLMRRRVNHSLTKKSRLSVKASCVAKRLVSKRTQVLKSLLPGGKDIDEFSLIEEALDYVVSLRAQVDVMKCVANASLLLSSSTK